MTEGSQPAIDQASGRKFLVAAGAPPYLGTGFGDAQAKMSNACMFGLRAQLPAAITLGEVATKMQALAQLIRQPAAVEPLQQAS